MRINLTRDINVFLASAGRWLTKDPVGNNVLLTTIAAQHAGHVKGDESALYGWAEDRGEILGALRWPPPLPATLTVMPPASAGALAAALPSAEQTARQQIDEQLAGGRLYVWEGGQLAAVTGHAPPAENVVLVHGGFASPDHRDSWYGTAIVAAVCKHLLGQGYSCISITDRGNPHAGATLRAIGFEPTANLTDFQFGARQ